MAAASSRRSGHFDRRASSSCPSVPARTTHIEIRMTEHPVASWHRLVSAGNPAALSSLLADDAVFFSPVVHAPQRGKALVAMYLSAALSVFSGPAFRYVREIVGDTDA